MYSTWKSYFSLLTYVPWIVSQKHQNQKKKPTQNTERIDGRLYTVTSRHRFKLFPYHVSFNHRRILTSLSMAQEYTVKEARKVPKQQTSDVLNIET